MKVLKILASILVLLAQIYAITSASLSHLWASSPIFVVCFALSLIANIISILQYFFNSKWWLITLEIVLLIPNIYFFIEIIKNAK